jgi:hypothetical protein
MLQKAGFFFIGSLIPLSATAIELTDYIDPDSFYDDAFVTGQFNLNAGNQDQTSFNANALAEYEATHSTLPFTWNVKFDGNFDVVRGPQEGDSTDKGYDLFFNGNADKYFNPNNNFLGYGSLEMGYRRSKGADEADDPYTKIGAGVGYGRVINATPLANVFRIVEELIEYGIIVQPLSDDAYLELAAIIDREDEYESRYGFEDYEHHWVQAMEKVLQRAGVLKSDTLGAVGVLKMHDVLFDEKISTRKHGWIGKAGLGFVLSNYDGSDSDPSVDASFEYAFPFSHKLQLIESAKYSSILSDDLTHRFKNEVSVTYELSDRIDWENEWNLDLTLPTGDETKDLVKNDLSSAFRYYISNLLDANFTVQLSHMEDDISDNGNDDVDLGVAMGLRYRLK